MTSASDLVSVTLLPAMTIGVLTTILWLISVRLRNSSIVDSFWSLGFLIICVAGLVTSGDGNLSLASRPAIVFVLVTIWSLRLCLHITRRNWGAGEDSRYAAIRRRYGAGFWWKSLFIVFWFQGFLIIVIGLPLHAVNAVGSSPLTPLDAIGAIVFVVGLTFESLADRQLRKFKRVPANRGKLMTRGLWSISRHPNYFGDALLWWGLGIIGLAASGNPLVLAGPALMTFFLRYVSGVPLLERAMEGREGFAQYAATTPIFTPRLSCLPFPKQSKRR